MAQDSPTCTNAGVEGSLVLEARGDFLAGAPFMGPVVLIAELAFSVNASGDGVISGNIAGSEDRLGGRDTFVNIRPNYFRSRSCPREPLPYV